MTADNRYNKQLCMKEFNNCYYMLMYSTSFAQTWSPNKCLNTRVGLLYNDMLAYITEIDIFTIF